MAKVKKNIVCRGEQVSGMAQNKYSSCFVQSFSGGCTDEQHHLYFEVEQHDDKTFSVSLSRNRIVPTNFAIACAKNLTFCAMMKLIDFARRHASSDSSVFYTYLDEANRAALGSPCPTIFYDG